jgi:nucleoside-diphosphate-sugar epimerase
MTLTAFQKGRIIIMGGGLQWRPLVHLSDVSRAFTTVISANKNVVNQEIFNVGLNNFQIKDIAYIVREELSFPVEIEIAPDDVDARDYNVLFKKAEECFGFKANVEVSQGIREIYSALKLGKVDVGPKTVTVQWYRNIMAAKELMDSILINGRLI